MGRESDGFGGEKAVFSRAKMGGEPFWVVGWVVFFGWCSLGFLLCDLLSMSVWIAFASLLVSFLTSVQKG